MQFALDDDRALLARSTRELLEKEAGLATNRQIMESEAAGYSKALFGDLAGNLILVVCGVLWLLGVAWTRRIVKAEA